MQGILLTQDSGMIIGPVAKILGYLMEGIFFVIDKIGIPNIGLAIIKIQKSEMVTNGGP